MEKCGWPGGRPRSCKAHALREFVPFRHRSAMVNESLLELVNNPLILNGMKSLSLNAGRRARQIVPGLAVQAATVAAAQPAIMSEDFRLFWTTLVGGLVFFGTYLA